MTKRASAARPPQLPFDPSQEAVELLGVRHLRVRASLQWPDAAGRWQLVLLASPSHQVSVLGRTLIGATSGLLVLTLLLLLLRAAHNQLASRAALASSDVIEGLARARRADGRAGCGGPGCGRNGRSGQACRERGPGFGRARLQRPAPDSAAAVGAQ